MSSENRSLCPMFLPAFERAILQTPQKSMHLDLLSWCREDGVVALLLLTEDLELQEELLLLEDLGIG